MLKRRHLSKKNYSLLWEISGNGLSKPSYLFGTMHLRDKRVFDFSDSVLIKFDACEAFASEVRMDSTMYEYWELTVNGDTTNRLRNQLSKKGYARMKDAFKKKGINFDSLYSKNTALLQDWLEEKNEEEDKEGSKKQFLDLYLTRLAHNQNKTLYGLENLGEYKNLNEAFFERFEDTTWIEKKATFADMMMQFSYLENLIETYNEGNLDSIVHIINQDTTYSKSNYKEELLDNRNIRMVEKLDNLMREKSIFCAVGAAHLPDSLGMIALLRQRGYTLRCVTPQFTGMASQYKEKIVEREWYHVNDDFQQFEIDMPEQPYKMYAKRLGMQYVYFDIGNSSLSLVQAEYYPHLGMKKISNEKLLNELFRRWQAETNYVDFTKEKVKIGDIDAYKFKAHTYSKGLTIGYFTVANNYIYKIVISYDKNNQDDISKGERILKSFKINPLPLTDWQSFQDAKGAFSARFPTPPQFEQVKNKIPNQDGEEVNYYANLFMSKDAKNGYTYLLRYSDLPNGSVILNDSIYMAAVMTETTEKFKKLKARIDIDSLSNHYGYQERNLKISIEGINMYLRLILRGSRLYFLLGQPPLVKDKTHEKTITDWLNSFKLESFNTPQLKPIVDTDLGITFSFPSSIEKYKKDDEKSFFPFKNVKSYNITHDHSGVSYFVNTSNYSKYFSIPSYDSLLTSYVNDIKENDTITQKGKILVIKDTLINGIKAKFLISKHPKVTVNMTYELVFEKNGKLYECGVYVPNESTDSVFVQSFFNTIKMVEDKNIINIYEPKKQLIFNDLASQNDSIRDDAKKVLSSIDWEKSDIPLFTHALVQNYKDDTLKYNSVRLNLLGAVKSIKDSVVLSTIEQIINTTKDTVIKDKCICALLDLDTLGSANRFFELAKQYKRSLKELYCLSSFMSDSIERAVTYYDQMLSIPEKPFEDDRVIYITWLLTNYDTSGLMNNIFKKYTPQYLATASSVFDKNSLFKRDTVADGEYSLYSLISSYVKLCPLLENNTNTNNFLYKVTTTQQSEILCDALFSLVKNKQNIDNSLWERASKSKSYWYYLLSRLNNDTLLNSVPPQYYTQKEVAQGNIIYSNYDDDMSEPNETTFLETQKYKGEILYIFKLLYKYGDEEENYIGINAQPSDKNKVDFSPKISLLSEPLENVKDYKKVVKQLLKNYEENKTEND